MRVRIIIGLMWIFSCSGAFGQESDLIVTEIGTLMEGGAFGFDGGSETCQVKVLKEKCNIPKSKLKLKGQVISLTGEPMPIFDIYLGYIENHKLLVTDTIKMASHDYLNRKFWNNKRKDLEAQGVFTLNTKLQPKESVYISVVGGSLLEIKLVDKTSD